MVSDVLYEALKELDEYLTPFWSDVYPDGEVRERIVRLRNEMNALRIELDSPPRSEEAEVA